MRPPGSQKPFWITLDFKEHRPPARWRSPRRSPTTVASPVGQYPGTCSGDSVDRQNDGAPVLCAAACLLAVLTYGEALLDRIVSYRDILCDIVSYRIVSLMAVSCHHYNVAQLMFPLLSCDTQSWYKMVIWGCQKFNRPWTTWHKVWQVIMMAQSSCIRKFIRIGQAGAFQE